MAISRGLFGIVAFASDDGKEYVPENDNGEGNPVVQQDDENDAADKEEVLDFVTLPAEVLEVELEREHGKLGDHQHVKHKAQCDDDHC